MRLHVRHHITEFSTDDGHTAVMNTGKVAEKFQGMDNHASGILPPAVRWIARDGYSVLAERPPFMLNTNDGNYLMPWTVYALDFTEHFENLNYFGIYTRSEQIYTPTDTLNVFPFVAYDSTNAVDLVFGDSLQQFSFDQGLSTELLPAFENVLNFYGGAAEAVTLAEALMAVVAQFWRIFAHSSVIINASCDNIGRPLYPSGTSLAALPEIFEASQNPSYRSIFGRWNDVLTYERLSELRFPELTTVETVTAELQRLANLRVEPSFEQRLLKIFRGPGML